MIRVGILRGGNILGHEKSVAIGSRVLKVLKDDTLNQKYKTHDIYLDKDGLLHLNGIPTTLEKLHHNVDVILNFLYDTEDGKIQQFLDSWNLRHTSPSPFVLSRINNKVLRKEHLVNIGFSAPLHISLKKYQDNYGDQDLWANKNSKQIWQLMPPPWFVTNHSLDINIICNTYPQLVEVLASGVAKNDDLLIEEYISGKEFTLNILENFRNQNVYTFPILEKKNNNDFIYPTSLNQQEKNKIESNAIKVYKEFGLEHYSQIDFILSRGGKVYVKQIKTIPELIDNSSLLKSLDIVGANDAHLLESMIENALSKK